MLVGGSEKRNIALLLKSLWWVKFRVTYVARNFVKHIKGIQISNTLDQQFVNNVKTIQGHVAARKSRERRDRESQT